MTYRFTEALDDYTAVTSHPHSAARQYYDAAMRLPQAESRQIHVNQADGIVRADYAARSWVAGVEDASHNLPNLITIHDNGGTASSPAKIKRAARDLLRLLGED